MLRPRQPPSRSLATVITMLILLSADIAIGASALSPSKTEETVSNVLISSFSLDSTPIIVVHLPALFFGDVICQTPNRHIYRNGRYSD